LLFFSETSPIRKAVYSLVVNPWFDNLMVVFILLNCICMAYEYPDMPDNGLDTIILNWA
jgi:hypothetical protein